MGERGKGIGTCMQMIIIIMCLQAHIVKSGVYSSAVEFRVANIMKKKYFCVSSKIADSCTNTDDVGVFNQKIIIITKKNLHVVISNSHKSPTCYHMNSNNFTIN